MLRQPLDLYQHKSSGSRERFKQSARISRLEKYWRCKNIETGKIFRREEYSTQEN
jgi:hypothetical protein